MPVTYHLIYHLSPPFIALISCFFPSILPGILSYDSHQTLFFDFKYESDKTNADKTIVSYRTAVRIPQDDDLFHALKHSVSLRETLCFTPRNESFQALKQSVSNKVETNWIQANSKLTKKKLKRAYLTVQMRSKRK